MGYGGFIVNNNGYQRMVQEYYVKLVRDNKMFLREMGRNISDEAGLSLYQKKVQEIIDQSFSPRPEKTPLKPRITGVVERSNYCIEKVLFESRPECLVSANLYIPKNLEKPAPGIIAPCGHSGNGKASDLYQGFCQRLAHSGFVVLIYDPFNQGERDQYALLSERESVKSCCPAHNMMGKQMELIGEFFGMWRVWDGIRALDYLLTRPEVDPSQIGLTGNSGGGTLTTWLWAVEERFTMAAPGCFVTTFLHNLENELPADCEQYPPGVIGAGLEMADFFIVRAPKPVILLGQKYDYFDRRGLVETYLELQEVYKVLKAPKDNLKCFIGPWGHGYRVENQEAMVDFFTYHTGKKAVRVPETEVLKDEELYATKSGNVIKEGSRPVYELIAEKADALASKRKPLSADLLKVKLMEILNILLERDSTYYRVLRPTRIDKTTFARYAVETEEDILAIMKKRMKSPEYSYTLDVDEAVHLYLPHLSSEDDILEDPLAISLKQEHELYALDVRGLGESIPEDKNQFLQPYGMDYMYHGYGLLMNQSYLGRRVYDVLCTIDLFINEGAKKIHLYGRGQGAIMALFAGVLHDNITSVTLKNAPESYESWVHTPLVAWASANFPHNILKFMDIPDCIKFLGDKVTIMEPWGADMKPL